MPASSTTIRIGLGLGTLALAAPATWLAWRAHSIFPDPERAVASTAAEHLFLLVVPCGIYLAYGRARAEARRAGLIFLLTALLLMCGIWLYATWPAIVFPADILIWSESDFVNDIIKFRSGYPLYSDPRNNESFIYPPGSQLLTYGLAWLMGKPLSIPAYRAIQLFYVLLAVGFALACQHRIARMAACRGEEWYLWSALTAPFLFLAATNPLTNPFTVNLHNDALALLVSTVACYVSLGYAETRRRRFLLAMILLPVAGFAVKQSLLVWLPLFLVQVVGFDSPRSWRRILLLSAAGSVAALLAIAGGYLLWGEPFGYWVLSVLGSRGVSPLRSFRHLLTVWPYVAAGLAAGWVLLRGPGARRLAGPWLVWLLLTASQIYTSGIAWMMNHIGPGSLLAGVWFAAALERLWPALVPRGKGFDLRLWWRAASVTAGLLLLCGGLGYVRTPLPAIPDRAYAYVRAIEEQFRSEPIDSVLLDAGSWVYLKAGVIMKDRAPCIGDRGYSQTGDFSGLLQRIEQRQYKKILLRRFHSPDFWYDHYLWPNSSGIRKKLRQNYDEIQRIGAGWDSPPDQIPPYLFDEISVLLPKR